MVGIGFFGAAILRAVLSAQCMSVVYALEQRLRSRSGAAIAARYYKNFLPNEEVMRKVSLENGDEIARDTLSITFRDGQPGWHFLAVARGKRKVPRSPSWDR